ncbi:carbon monoxide dehydrogenase accessory protein [Prescottella agglutinans]|uniref:Carbon monoxide dehydrogenase accessory protein n=1 Tax=Prescottella agglutinans TaxID=1644129 RepID=A0A438BJT0_9NOCA|nr:XdhC family protein [Prescottella agglutinans]RVW11131.1 carbon monoxide dehydrogenase accessory protein [Prescottella agglutinans]
MDLAARAAQLTGERRPYVRATVVRAQQPTSSSPGDGAIVLPDGTIEGFVGGHCAQNSVRQAATDALEAGESVLLRILPGGGPDYPEVSGARIMVNPCLSGGAMEIFLQPCLPAPIVRVVGESPVADAVAHLAGTLDLDVRRGATPSEGECAVVVASLGGDEPGAVREALDAGAGYVGLVASRVRGAAILDELALGAAERGVVHTPAGLAIGARTPAEIALAILAELVHEIRVEDLAERTSTGAAESEIERLTVIDPVCGMTVIVDDDTPHLQIDGEDYWFCAPGCRRAYEKERARCS